MIVAALILTRLAAAGKRIQGGIIAQGVAEAAISGRVDAGLWTGWPPHRTSADASVGNREHHMLVVAATVIADINVITRATKVWIFTQ